MSLNFNNLKKTRQQQLIKYQFSNKLIQGARFEDIFFNKTKDIV